MRPRHDEANLPAEQDADKNVVWKVVTPGDGPVVAGTGPRCAVPARRGAPLLHQPVVKKGPAPLGCRPLLRGPKCISSPGVHAGVIPRSDSCGAGFRGRAAQAAGRRRRRAARPGQARSVHRRGAGAAARPDPARSRGGLPAPSGVRRVGGRRGRLRAAGAAARRGPAQNQGHGPSALDAARRGRARSIRLRAAGAAARRGPAQSHGRGPPALDAAQSGWGRSDRRRAAGRRVPARSRRGRAAGRHGRGQPAHRPAAEAAGRHGPGRTRPDLAAARRGRGPVRRGGRHGLWGSHSTRDPGRRPCRRVRPPWRRRPRAGP